jgi:hypothetical protein
VGDETVADCVAIGRFNFAAKHVSQSNQLFRLQCAGFQKMKRSTKAVLISGLVFPGLGHIFLRRYVVGLVLLCLAGGSIYYIAETVIDTALDVVGEIESGGMAIDSGSISQLVEERSEQTDRSASLAVWMLMACWVIGIIDSYRVGRAQERLNESSVANRT